MRVLRTFSFHEEDKEILEHLDRQNNRSAYIRELIKKDMLGLPKELKDKIDKYIDEKLKGK